MGILDRLTEGNENNDNNEENKFHVYVQFDEDDPLLLALDIDIENDFILQLHPESNNYVCIRDNQTGKELKIFAKAHNSDNDPLKDFDGYDDDEDDED